MGGTSFDVSVVSGGQPTRRNRGELMGIWTALSLVDVDSIGAGGGSLGWVDARGMLRVGPHSAGAVPGPACYGRGGTEPTVTDALLVLGYLAPDRFLGGDMALDAAAARRGLPATRRRRSASGPTRWRGASARWRWRAWPKRCGAASADAAWIPRNHALVSYGGCGGLFAADIARAIGATRVVVPELASVLSAFGAATADVRGSGSSRWRSLSPSIPMRCAAVADKLRAEVDADVAADGIAAADRSVHFEVDLRFKRQKWELSVPLTGALIDEAALTRLLDDFRADYARRYGEGALMAGAVIELVGAACHRHRAHRQGRPPAGIGVDRRRSAGHRRRRAGPCSSPGAPSPSRSPCITAPTFSPGTGWPALPSSMVWTRPFGCRPAPSCGSINIAR